MEEEELKYNTQRKKLILPEYGRNIHIMVNYLLTIKDREERTKAAKTVIDVMGNLYPHLRDVPDFRHKLWDHLAIMSDFKLDIDTPYPLPSMENCRKTDSLSYGTHHIKYRHYGKLVEKLIEEIPESERPRTKTGIDCAYRQPHEKIFSHLEQRQCRRRANLQRHQHPLRKHSDSARGYHSFQSQRFTAKEKQAQFQQTG